MEEDTVISLLITRGYDVKIEEQLNAAIEVLKEESAKVGAYAVIILPPDHDKNVEAGVEKDDEDKVISAKAIRYKHFYY